MRRFVISNEESGQSLEKYFRKVLINAPLSFIYKILRKKDIKVNGKKENKDYILRTSDIVEIYVKNEAFDAYGKSDTLIKSLVIKPWIVFEDENILIVNKPRGVASQTDLQSGRKGLDRLALEYFYASGQYNPTQQVGFIPSLAHRLDLNTSGVIIFGKNMETLQCLFELMQDKTALVKKYEALVVGEVDKDGTIDAPLIKNERTGMVRVDFNSEKSKPAKTLYHVLKKYQGYTLLELTLLSGRTHQIRVHTSYMGYPIVGDTRYGDFMVNKSFEEQFHFTNQFLHAKSLEFVHPKGRLKYLKGKCFRAEMPEEYLNILRNI